MAIPGIRPNPFVGPRMSAGMRARNLTRGAGQALQTVGSFALGSPFTIPALGLAAVGSGLINVPEDDPNIDNRYIEAVTDFVPFVGGWIGDQLDYSAEERATDLRRRAGIDVQRAQNAITEAQLRAQKEAQKELETRMATAGTPEEMAEYVQDYQEVSNEIAQSYANSYGVNPNEFMSGTDMIDQVYSPDGQVFQGMELMADNAQRRHIELERLRHGMGMEYSSMSRQAEQAANMLNFALGDRNSHRSYLAALASNINYQ